jgi:hypothetical protein
MQARRVVRGVGLLAAAAVLGCGDRTPAAGLDGAAARAVARRVQAAEPERRLVVHGTIGADGRTELPFGVRQSLVTAGVEVADDAALSDPAVRVLVIDGGGRVADGWRMETHLREGGRPLPPVVWRVECGGGCAVVDSAAAAGR